MYVRTKPDSRHKHKEYRDLTLGIGRKDYNQLSKKKWERKMSVGELQQAVGNSAAYSLLQAQTLHGPQYSIL